MAGGTRSMAGPETDLPVLLPVAGARRRDSVFERHDGRLFVSLKAWHGLALAGLFVLSWGTAQAATPSGALWLLETLLKWIPFILEGFALNLLISFLAMAIGSVAGAALGLMQVSLMLPVRTSSWVVTQFFRNSPWLVLLFCIMLLFPFEIDLGFAIVPVPDWMKAVIGFSLPVMANISEVVRGAVLSIPTGQWESAESLAFTRRQTLWMIILPQCVKRMIPPWINWYCILAMATPLCSIMGVEESVTHTAQALNAEGDKPELLGPFYLFLLLIFFFYTYPITRFSIRIEKRYAVKI